MTLGTYGIVFYKERLTGSAKNAPSIEAGDMVFHKVYRKHRKLPIGADGMVFYKVTPAIETEFRKAHFRCIQMLNCIN